MNQSPTTQTLYVQRQQHQHHPQPLTVGYVLKHIAQDLQHRPFWLTLEPRVCLPTTNGRRIKGRLPGLEPLSNTLPPDTLNDLPLLAASIYTHTYWQHWHDGHPLSKQAICVWTWQTQRPEAKELGQGKPEIHTIHNCQRKVQSVLRWEDRARFGLDKPASCQEPLEVEQYHHQGKLVAWRLMPIAKD